jgi:hypothetical protein
MGDYTMLTDNHSIARLHEIKCYENDRYYLQSSVNGALMIVGVELWIIKWLCKDINP